MAVSFTIVTLSTGKDKVIITFFYSPAFKAELYCAEFSMLNLEKRALFLSADGTFYHI